MAKIWKYYDYAYKTYRPIASCQGKILSDALLYNSFSQSPCQKQFLSLIKKIKNAIGPWNTVWGVKFEKGKMSWELYFYDHGRRNPNITVTRLLKIIRPDLKTPVFKGIDIERQPYFMFSMNLSEDVFKNREFEGVRLYTRGRWKTAQGNSYYWNRDGCVLENLYNTYKIPAETVEWAHTLKHSFVFAPYLVEFLKSDLVRQLMVCGKISMACKRDKEGIYFSRVNIEQLLFFLKYFSYPDYVTGFISSQKQKLDHLLFDVAFDCALGPKGIVFGKSSYHGGF